MLSCATEESSEFFSFWKVAAFSCDVVGSNPSRFSCALSSRESVAALAALLGWGRTEEEAAETWGKDGEVPKS